MEVGAGVKEKSGAGELTFKVAERESEPLVPVTVTVKVPLAEDVHERLEDPEPIRLVGPRLQTSPVEGETE